MVPCSAALCVVQQCSSPGSRRNIGNVQPSFSGNDALTSVDCFECIALEGVEVFAMKWRMRFGRGS